MKKKYIIVISLIGVLSLLLIFKNDKEEVLVKDDINIKNTIAMYKSEDKTNYTEIEEMPSEGYIVNEEKTYCTTDNINQVKGKVKTIDGNIVITNINKNDKCYVWFDRLDDEKPIISDVATSVTKTEITVTVTATDNIGVTEYWYQIDSNEAIKGTGNTYKFTGLSAGTTYSVKVYVKDAAGNQSDTTEKSVTTSKPTGSETILANLGTSIKTTTPNFVNAATTDEGVYAISDGMYGGTTYYWRGAVTNNFVKFAGFCWRIVRINGDGSIRLIYDGTPTNNVCSGSRTNPINSPAYNSVINRSEYVGWTYSIGSQRPVDTSSGTASSAKTLLENWYSNNITGTNLNKVVDGKYCNDREIAMYYNWSSQGSTFYYSGYDRSGARSASNVNPSLNCNLNDIYILKVGIITMDEVIMAGGKWGVNNNQFYLCNFTSFWTMTPHLWDGGSYNYRLEATGNFNISYLNDSTGLRPVINLNSNVTFSGGIGTQSNPYVVE